MDDLAFSGFDEAVDRAAEGLARSVVDGLSPAVAEALADPIVRAMMAADRVDPAGLEVLLRQTAAQLGPSPRRRHDHHHKHQRLCHAGRG